ETGMILKCWISAKGAGRWVSTVSLNETVLTHRPAPFADIQHFKIIPVSYSLPILFPHEQKHGRLQLLDFRRIGRYMPAGIKYRAVVKPMIEQKPRLRIKILPNSDSKRFQGSFGCDRRIIGDFQK